MGYSERSIIRLGLDYSVRAGSGSMGNRFYEEAQMNGRRISKLVHEGAYVAEMDVETIFTDDRCSLLEGDTHG